MCSVTVCSQMSAADSQETDRSTTVEEVDREMDTTATKQVCSVLSSLQVNFSVDLVGSDSSSTYY